MPADLFKSEISPPLASIGRIEPRLWIRRMAIFSDPKTIIRDIPLKPGLNIVWTPDMSNSGNRTLAHGSGKTTFCRLLRACLGETSFATDAQRSRIAGLMPYGSAAAEILIDGVCWVSVRPFGLPGGEFVVRVASIEDALARGRREGDLASIDSLVTDAFFPMMAGATPSDIGREQVWDVLRAWLTRDQECRLADILAWRSAQTQSRSRAQVLGETSKLMMVRLALRALDREEQTAAVQERQLMAGAEDERRRQVYQQQRFADSLKLVRGSLQVSEEVGFEDTLNQKGLLSLAEAALEKAIRTDLPKPPDVKSIFARLNTLNDERRKLEAELLASDQTSAFKTADAERYRSEANLGEIDLTQGGIRICPICRVSVDATLANGCGISLQRCNLDELKASLAAKRTTAIQLDGEASAATAESKRIQALIEKLLPRQTALEQEAESADKDNRKTQDAAKGVQDQIYRARRVLDDVRSLWDAELATKPTPPNTAALDAIRAKLDAGRARARAAIRTLEERYQGIMAAWLPDGVEGIVKLDGNGLKVDAQFAGRGEVSTAALDSLKIVAFDLAALHMAVEEKADLPAFLIHDSPREADLDAQLYERLFTLMYQWEVGSKTPCFQYIVTTTTAPPKELQSEVHVRLQMSSTPSEMRLFRMDL